MSINIEPPENTSALAKAMNQLINHDNERQRLSLNALEVTTRFSIDKIIQDWWKDYFRQKPGSRRRDQNRVVVGRRPDRRSS